VEIFYFKEDLIPDNRGAGIIGQDFLMFFWRGVKFSYVLEKC
jgi:hypothetical protein